MNEPYVIIGWPAFSLGFPPQFIHKDGLFWTDSLKEARRFEYWDDAWKVMKSEDHRKSLHREPMMITRAYWHWGVHNGMVSPSVDWLELDWRFLKI